MQQTNIILLAPIAKGVLKAMGVGFIMVLWIGLFIASLLYVIYYMFRR